MLCWCCCGAASAGVAGAADAAGPLAVGGSPMVLVLLLVHAGTGSSAGAAGFKLLNRNPVSVALFGAQQTDSQQGC